MDSDEKKCTRCSVIIPIFFVMDICMECEIELQKKEIITQATRIAELEGELDERGAMALACQRAAREMKERAEKAEASVVELREDITFWTKCLRENMPIGLEQHDPEPQMLMDMEKSLKKSSTDAGKKGGDDA